jgi:hypothetical protein
MVSPDNTFKRIRIVVYGTWLLIEPCHGGPGAHRFSVGATALFSAVVLCLTVASLIQNDLSFGVFLFIMLTDGITLIAAVMLAIGCGEIGWGEIGWGEIGSCQLVFFNIDIHFLF